MNLLNTDCLDFMKGCKDQQFDMCITSPPYNMNLRVNSKGDGYCSRQIVKEISTKYTNYHDNLSMADYEQFLTDVISELIRICGITFFNIQMITGNKPALFRIIGKFADQIKEVIIWDKCKGQPAIGEGVMNSRYEFILVFGDRPITRAFSGALFDRGTLDNLWPINPSQSADKSHSASFPIELVETILYSFKANTLFDPFMGTGTTAIAAHYHDIEFTGCEIDEDYHKSAVERIERDTAQISLL